MHRRFRKEELLTNKCFYLGHLYPTILIITLFRATRTLIGSIPVMTFLFSICWIMGMVIFANYADCDPMKLGYISDIDEILPFYVEDKFIKMKGFLGVVMASLFNGAFRYVLNFKLLFAL